MLVDSCPYPGVCRLLVCLKMVDKVQEDTFEAVLFKVFPHKKCCSIGIDGRANNCVITLVPKPSNGGIDMKDVGENFHIWDLLVVCRLIWLNNLHCCCAGIIEDTGARDASGCCLAFRLEMGRDQLWEVFDSLFQLDNVTQDGLTDPRECFFDKLQEVFEGYVTSLDIVIVVVFVMAVVWAPLASEVIKDLLELVALLLELGFDLFDKGIESVQASMNSDGGHWAWCCLLSRFNDIIL